MSHETCREHPDYKAVYAPRCTCKVCWLIWFITRYGSLAYAAHDLFNEEKGILECLHSNSKRTRPSRSRPRAK
jgi:hypothetical protein